jgi:hypothetical protein
MIIYGVWMCDQPTDTLRNLFEKQEDAIAFVESMRHPSLYYVDEVRVY